MCCPGKCVFTLQGQCVYAFWDVGQLATWLTGFVSKTKKKLKPKSNMSAKQALKVNLCSNRVKTLTTANDTLNKP